MFIEGDISASTAGHAIMAHPPAKESDLAFADWVHAVCKARRGAKLDIKDPSVVPECVGILKTMLHHKQLPADIPVWLNADLVTGACVAG